MKVLVTAASRHGSTAEIATIIAGILQASDIDAEAVPPEAVASVADYDAVILGSAVYAGQWLEPARAFVARHADDLATRPVFLFSSGPLGYPSRRPVEPADAVAVETTTGAMDLQVFPGRLIGRDLSLPERLIATKTHAAVRRLPALGRHPRLDARDRPLPARGVGRGGRPASGRWRRVTRPPDLTLEVAHALAVGAVAAEAGVDPRIGLSSRDAQDRAAEAGPNALSAPDPPKVWRLVLRSATQPFVLVLLVRGHRGRRHRGGPRRPAHPGRTRSARRRGRRDRVPGRACPPGAPGRLRAAGPGPA